MNLKKSKHKETPPAKKSRLRENIEAILIAIVLALFIRAFVVQAFKIPSGSMLNTLQIGDHILVNKFIYGVKVPKWHQTIIPIKSPRRGDIIVFEYPQDRKKDFIKRVVGVPGDTVEIHDKQLYINDQPVNLPYTIFSELDIKPAYRSPRDNFGPTTVPPESVFVMGDNRDNSHDSRFWGFVKYREIKGKAFVIYWSWDRNEPGVRWKRLGRGIR